jgi:serine/threonine protein kinase
MSAIQIHSFFMFCVVFVGLGNLVKHGKLLKTACGSPCYAAPEVSEKDRETRRKVDV